MGGGGGGGGAMEKLWPGYKDKIWQRVPSQYRRLLIGRWNRAYDQEALHTLILSRRLASYHKSVVDPLKPSYNYRIPRVDYKRQLARGTAVEAAPDYYVKSVWEQGRVERLEEPYTEEEASQRRERRFFSMKVLLISCGAYVILDGYMQRRPIAWCLDLDPIHPPHYPWWFNAATHGHDISSVRRGYEVYRQVCATCHSIKEVHFRHLVGEVYPEERVKQIAATYDVEDGPNDVGENFTRPGSLTDRFPSPYPNNNSARFANNGALPPDMSCMAASTHAGPSYIMAVLLGYHDPPEGMNLRDGLYYNAYFPGGTIAMPPQLEPDLVEYEDGTAATVPQMAKDVASFLAWSSEPIHDRRKQLGMKWFWSTVGIWILLKMYYRMFQSMMASRRVDFGKIKYM
eukprot:GHVQ01003741.1.p1 GENE.GHVQ01003741.1~~GHVQ01003741.1.p1  ORF type:complete len:400 (-),score=38.94 GHVQ01003741.1:469-1668(-)